jgi:hypothetical protein
MHPSELEQLQVTTLPAVKCVACGTLHEYSNNTWITLYAKWETPQLRPTLGRRDPPPKQGGAGFNNTPIVVCDSNTCVLRAMGRLNTDN